jgi:hypothetical protein
MKNKTKARKRKLIVKECVFCGDTFYARRNSAKYCSDTCKVKFSNRKIKAHQWYSEDPNKGKILPPGTVTSWEMPEDKLIFKGDKASLYRKLSEKVSEEQLIQEKECIERRKPFSETKEWGKSCVQIFTDEDFMEVFRISPEEYKFYVWPWENDEEKPF